MKRMGAAAAVWAVVSMVLLARARPAEGQEACPCCAVDCAPAPADPTLAEERAVLIGGVALAAVSYLAGTTYALSRPSSVTAIDAIPVAGAVAAAARNGGGNVAGLLFSAATQAIGILGAAAAGTHYFERKARLKVDLCAAPGSASVTVGFRFR